MNDLTSGARRADELAYDEAARARGDALTAAMTPEERADLARRHDLVMAALAPYDARGAYSALVLAIGDGFHPDTRGADYTSLPDGYTPARVDQIVDRFVATSDEDPSAVANELLDAVRDEGVGTWTELQRIADALDASVDPHGLIDLPAEGEGRFVLVDREAVFRIGLYERDHDLALVMVEAPTVDETIAAARVLSSHWIEVAR